MLLLLISTLSSLCIAAVCHAALELPLQRYKINGIAHRTPSAVSQQIFTRIHHQLAYVPQQQSIRATSGANAAYKGPFKSAIVVAEPLLHAPVLQAPTAARVSRIRGTPIVETLTRTPAHLTFSAAPVVFQTLPQIKPVRKISYDELRPAANGLVYA